MCIKACCETTMDIGKSYFITKYFNHSPPLHILTLFFVLSSLTPFFPELFFVFKKYSFLAVSMFNLAFSLFLSNVFLARNFNFILLKHPKTNTRAFSSEGTTFPNIPVLFYMFFLYFSPRYLSPVTSIHVCCLNQDFITLF